MAAGLELVFHNKFVVDLGGDTNLILIDIKDMDYEMKIINFLKVNKFVFPNIYRISVNFQRE